MYVNGNLNLQGGQSRDTQLVISLISGYFRFDSRYVFRLFLFLSFRQVFIKTASAAYPDLRNYYLVVSFFNKKHGLLKMSLRNVFYDLVGSTLLSVHIVWKDVFGEIHILQRSYTNR